MPVQGVWESKPMLTAAEMDVSNYLGWVDNRMDDLTRAVIAGDLAMYSKDYIAGSTKSTNLAEMSQRELSQLFAGADWSSNGGMAWGRGIGFIKAMNSFFKEINSNGINLTPSQLSQIKDYIQTNMAYSFPDPNNDSQTAVTGTLNLSISDGNGGTIDLVFDPTGKVSASTTDSSGNVTVLYSIDFTGAAPCTKADFAPGKDGQYGTANQWGGLVGKDGTAWIGDNVGIDPGSTAGMQAVSSETDTLARIASVLPKAVKTLIDIAKAYVRMYSR